MKCDRIVLLLIHFDNILFKHLEFSMLICNEVYVCLTLWFGAALTYSK